MAIWPNAGFVPELEPGGYGFGPEYFHRVGTGVGDWSAGGIQGYAGLGIMCHVWTPWLCDYHGNSG